MRPFSLFNKPDNKPELQEMQTYQTLTAYIAAADKHAIPADYIGPLLTFTRRGVEADDKTVRAWITRHRHLDLTAEADGLISVWVVGVMEIAGRVVRSAVFVANIYDPTNFVRVVNKAKNLISEVIMSGSRAAPFIGEGVSPDGARVLIYRSETTAHDTAMQRAAAFVVRNDIQVKDADAAKVTKRTKSKANSATAATA
jgi:hypothetical protein